MATVVLGAAGQAVAGPAGGIVGGLLGSYLDQKFIMPELFGEPTFEGDRLDDFQFQNASEGSPIHFCQGPENKMSGTIIWMSDLIEVKIVTEQGGKGGGGVKSTTYEYFADVAIAVCEGVIDSITKMWANGKLIFETDNDIALAGTDVTTQRIGNPFSGGGFLLRLDAPDLGTDLSLLRSGADCTIAGFANGGNNGTFRVWSSEKFGAGNTRAFVIDVNAVTEAAGASVTIAQVIPDTDQKVATSTTIHTGTATQVADPIIEAFEGVGNVPPFRNIAYVVIERLNLADYGQRLPQFQFFVKKDLTITVAAAIGELVERSGLVAADYDTSAVSAGNLRGYVLTGPRSIARALQPIMFTHEIVMRESNKQMIFQMRNTPDVRAIITDDLGAREGGGNARQTIELVDEAGLDLPQEMNIQYIDPDNEYQTGSARERLINAPAQNTQQINLPLVLSGDTARNVASRKLWTAHANRTSLQIALPPSYMQVEENDNVTFTVFGENFNARVMRIDRGRNGLMVLDLVLEELHTLDYDRTQDVAEGGLTQVIDVASAMAFTLMDIAPLTDKDAKAPSLYYAAARADVRAQWKRGDLFRSIDDITYTSVDEIIRGARLGTVATAIGSGPVGFFDHLTKITVKLFEGELFSQGVLGTILGYNVCIVGDEIIWFQTATLVGTLEYELTSLLRGMRDTYDKIGSHVDSERFIWLNSVGFSRIELDTGSIGGTRHYKAVAVGGVLADEEKQTLTYQGNSIRPFSPAVVVGARDGSNNLTVTWEHVTRLNLRALSGQTLTLAEAVEKYEIDILDAPGGNVLRTIIVPDGDRTDVYLASEQTTDGLTPGDPVDMEIFQISSVVGRSKPRTATV